MDDVSTTTAPPPTEAMRASESTPGLQPLSAAQRWIFGGVGCVFVGLAVAGVFLPVLPATPFVLLASWCFARSSPRLTRWLERSPLLGPLLRDWRMHGGVRPGVKRTAYAMLAAVLVGALVFRASSLPVMIGTTTLAGIGAIVLWRLPTVR